MKCFYVLIATICLVGQGWGEAPAPALANGNTRVIFVGDSITGHGGNQVNGFVNVIGPALRAVYPESAPVLIPLGGSGQSVGGWVNVEKKSQTEEGTLDVRGVQVKASLDEPADVLVVMLGMNDVIAPYVNPSDASLEKWIAGYGTLVEALRKRVQPKIIALCSIPLCTEDLNSPKNLLIDQMNLRVRGLAEKVGARYLQTSESMKEVLNQGRRISPKFHLSGDYVHPNAIGHLAIAIAMLRGLGEPAAAQWLVDRRLTPTFERLKNAEPGIAWEVLSAQPEGEKGHFTFRIRYDWPGANAGTRPEVKLVAPEGWSVTPAQGVGASGEFSLSGLPDRLQNTFILEGRDGEEVRKTSGFIAAPWLLAAKMIQGHWSREGIFDVEKGRTVVCDAIESGLDFTAPSEVAGAPQLTWQPVFPNTNFLGGENPSNVDFAAITHAATFEGGYGARWIYSDRERAVKAKINHRMFAGVVYLTVWLNGEELRQGKLVKESVETTLKKGWNTLAFKANHRTWLWQFSIELIGNEGDSLDDLRYSALPHTTSDKSTSNR